MYEKSIELLNRAVADELEAVHQYMYFHFHCDDQGFDLLSNLFKKTAIEEMLHVELLAERILFLKGDVEMKPKSYPDKLHDVKDMLKQALAMEEQSVKDYNNSAVECSTNSDSVSRKLFEQLVADEERHMSQFGTELENLKKFGEQYLALQSIERSKTLATQTGASQTNA
ncbi:MAG: bacterioferritin [Candidatus Scalindua sp. AMX11]|nr:MAG: bacterioferritin [Candidatus Scalindua sp.]NOG84350.1 bacterioferritin [Planctomycetota bacterium]RZV74431.1 MAG: bacterioferritin [Candidatus Scalindua sp. SCAELEC01]TDE65352.1 MAG: bacterioferritin [Candidatus Scalindua sp. AMX11]GJQ60824.1 MAG: bacterioferritin [Candidatus Scalindua sp.]